MAIFRDRKLGYQIMDHLKSFSRWITNSFLSKMEISRLEYSNSKCTENMSWIRKDLWYNFFINNCYFGFAIDFPWRTRLACYTFSCQSLSETFKRSQMYTDIILLTLCLSYGPMGLQLSHSN